MQNGNRKSQVALLLPCYKLLFHEELPRVHQHHEEFARDFHTISKRTSSEGIEFLTRSLPALGKAIDASLKSGRLLAPGFQRRKRTVRGNRVRYALPNFLWVLLSRCFNPFTGRVLNDLDVCALNDLRQICYLAYKMELPYKSKDEQKVINGFVATDGSLPELNNCPGKVSEAIDLGNSLLQAVLSGFDPTDIQPMPGPGATADRMKPWEKYNPQCIYEQLETLYPFSEYFVLGKLHAWDQYYSKPEALPVKKTGAARVILVPKDSRGPRLISAEPSSYMFIQKGLSSKLVDTVEKHPLTKRRVNFTSQKINRRLALRGSIDGRYDTIDLSEASDRVSLELVKRLFKGTSLLGSLLATRTPRTVLPSGETIKLRKFAPMGSALCFPIEALSFWALGAGLLHVYAGLPIRKAARMLYVYGDDIIMQHGYAPYLIWGFQKVGLKVNLPKSCLSGFFRESCGCDAYRGQDVTPIKLRRPHPGKQRLDERTLLSYIDYSNQFWKKGYYSLALYFESLVEKSHGTIPLKENFDDDKEIMPSWYHRGPKHLVKQNNLRTRWNKSHQVREYFVLTPRGRSEERITPSWSELFRILSNKYSSPFIYPLPRRIKLKRGWRPTAYSGGVNFIA